MKFFLISIVLCATIYVACGMKLLASSSRQLNRRETKLVKRLVKRQASNGKTYQGYRLHFKFIDLIQILIVIVVLVTYLIVAKIL
jgi:hypothetical protein